MGSLWMTQVAMELQRRLQVTRGVSYSPGTVKCEDICVLNVFTMTFGGGGLCPLFLSLALSLFLSPPSFSLSLLCKVPEFVSLSPYSRALSSSEKVNQEGFLAQVSGPSGSSSSFPYVTRLWKVELTSRSLILLFQVPAGFSQTLIKDDHSLSNNKMQVKSWFNTVSTWDPA